MFLCIYCSLPCLLHKHTHTGALWCFVEQKMPLHLPTISTLTRWPRPFIEMPGASPEWDFLNWNGPLRESADSQSLFCLQDESEMVQKTSDTSQESHWTHWALRTKHTACAGKPTGSSSCQQQAMGHLPSVCWSGHFEEAEWWEGTGALGFWWHGKVWKWRQPHA